MSGVLRTWPVLVGCLLLGLCPRTAAFAKPPAEAPLLCTSQGALWHFHASSPLVGSPVVDRDGRVFVGSQEGYLHALRADGGFLWSYTIDGALSQALSLDSKGRVYAVSNQGTIYSLKGDGTPNWVFRSPVPPQTPVVFNTRGAGFFARGKTLHAVSSRAGLLWGINLKSPVSSGPILDKRGRAWLLTEDGMVHAVASAARANHWKSEFGSGQLYLVGDHVLLLQDGVLTVYRPDGSQLWQVSHVLQVEQGTTAARRSVAVMTPSALREYATDTGKLLRSVEFDARVNASPMRASGLHFVPGVAGDLWVLDGAAWQQCLVGQAPVLTPTLDRRRGRLIVGLADGKVTALELPKLEGRAAARSTP